MKKRIFSLLAIGAVFTLIGCSCGSWIKKERCEHEWGEGTVTRVATCTTEGETLYTCTNCGDIKTESIAKNNNHSPMVIPRVEPTCTVAGKDYGVMCSACGIVLIDQGELPALGHNYGADGVCQNGGNKCPILEENQLPPMPIELDNDISWAENWKVTY